MQMARTLKRRGVEATVRAVVIFEVSGEDGVFGVKEAKPDARGHRGDPWKERREVRNVGIVMKAREGVRKRRTVQGGEGCRDQAALGQ